MVDFVHIDWCPSKGHFGDLDCDCPYTAREEYLLDKYTKLLKAAEAYASWVPNELLSDWPAHMKKDRDTLIEVLRENRT